MMEVIVGGDFFVSSNLENELFFSESVINLFKSADFKVINLESPVTNKGKEFRIVKSGPHLKSSEKVISSNLKVLSIDAVTLANNHIKDYGEQGVIDTLNFCRKNDISFVGAGKNLKEASEIFYLKKNDLTLAIINISENEWSSAEDNSAGSYPLDVIDNVKLIQNAKKKADKVIVIIHGGIEHYNLPSPRMVKQYRFYIENGASIIIGHHTHCLGGYEIYKGAPIFYSLGNFLFTKKSSQKGWYTGLVLKLFINKTDIEWQLHPTRQNNVSDVVELLTKEEKELVLNEVSVLSSKISNKEILESEWMKFLSDKKRQYLSSYSFINAIPFRYIRAILSRLRVHNLIMSKRYLSFLINLIRCESHYDASLDILIKELKNK